MVDSRLVVNSDSNRLVLTKIIISIPSTNVSDTT
jgi:hypothetical protein